MKHNKVILGIFITIFLISIILTYHFLRETITFEVPLDNSVEYTRESDKHFVLIAQVLESEYLHILFDGAKASAQKHGASIEYWGTKQTNIEEHKKLLELAIASKVDGILTQGLSNEFEPVIKKAEAKGIPIIIVDSDIENNQAIPYVGTNNYQAGFVLGEKVANEADGSTKIGIVTGSFDANNLNERVQGFLDAISQKGTLEVVAIESSNLSKIQGAEKTYLMLRSHPDISVFVGTSAFDGLGIAEGIRKARPNSPIKVYGFDDIEENIQLLKSGEIHAILKQEPYEMGYIGVTLLMEILAGKQVKDDLFTPITILTKEDVIYNAEK